MADISTLDPNILNADTDFEQNIIHDLWISLVSREASLLGRKEVLTGKAKFGILGDGKEVPQVAMARVFKKGDWRSGYYRDQTMMMSAGLLNVQQFFAQLYAHPSIEAEPASGGRQMNGHYASRFIDESGNWLPQTEMKNSSADVSPTASQMPRLLGLAYASKFYRNSPELKDKKNFSNKGNEVAFGTIGNASTSEGHFFETINAAGVLQIPLAIFVYDDGYGISVPTKLQTTKGSISEALQGMQKEPNTNGIKIFTVKGWDYAALCEVFEQGVTYTRNTHVPVVFHVQELTQPQGHSTSGSHERYKSTERLQWEREWDGIKKMREWLLLNELSNESDLQIFEAQIKQAVRDAKLRAWNKYIAPINEKLKEGVALAYQGLSQDDLLT